MHVQHAFSLIQLCGDMMLHTQTLLEQVNAAILNSAPNLESPASPSHPFGYYDYLAVYHPEERTAAIQLLTAAQKGQFNVRPPNAHFRLVSNWLVNKLMFAGKGVWSILSSLSNQMQSLNEQAHSFAFNLIFRSLEKKLECVPGLQVN